MFLDGTLLVAGNFAPGNAGVPFYMDVDAPCDHAVDHCALAENPAINSWARSALVYTSALTFHAGVSTLTSITAPSSAFIGDETAACAPAFLARNGAAPCHSAAVSNSRSL
jgi:hypothetical protein